MQDHRVVLLAGDVFGGLWTGFIGWFLNSGAEASRQQVTAEGILAQIPVTRVMDPAPGYVSPELTLNEFVTEEVMRRGRRALPVIANGRMVGIVSITDAKHLSPEA